MKAYSVVLCFGPILVNQGTIDTWSLGELRAALHAIDEGCYEGAEGDPPADAVREQVEILLLAHSDGLFP